VPTALGLQLLKLYHARKAKAAPAPAARAAKRIDGAALRREFDAMLSDFNRRMGGNG
jgi:tRNA C32,U32 (ribose-2'-O)-methylase TrmJ